MASSEIFHADWCRQHFNLMAEGGVWAIPRSGLLFQKKGSTLRLHAAMPHHPAMPVTAAVLAAMQEAEYETVRSHFETAGITVTRD